MLVRHKHEFGVVHYDGAGGHACNTYSMPVPLHAEIAICIPPAAGACCNPESDAPLTWPHHREGGKPTPSVHCVCDIHSFRSCNSASRFAASWAEQEQGRPRSISVCFAHLAPLTDEQFVNLAGSSQLLVGNGLESCTNHVQSHQFDLDDHHVTLIDMPGFDDTNKSDTDILTMIADFLDAE
jgi:hypothetical protein